MRIPILALALLCGLSACSSEPDQEAIDKAVAEALAERDREKVQAGGDTGADAAPEPASDTTSDSNNGKSTEPLREGLSDGMGSPYGMCIRTLSIVGEHCGCMVNRATDAGIGSPALVRMFGGDGSRATQDEADRFTRIVRSCSGYNITVRNVGAAQRSSEPTSAAPRNTSLEGRRVACYFWNSVHEYDGACDFVAGRGGDFVATSLEGPYFDGVNRIALDVTSPGVGDLVIPYPNGDVQRTRVTRSESDRACWEAPKLTFCAR